MCPSYYPPNVDGADAEGCRCAQRRHLVRTAPAASATKLTSKGSEVSLETTFSRSHRALRGGRGDRGEIAAGLPRPNGSTPFYFAEKPPYTTLIDSGSILWTTCEDMNRRVASRR